MKKYIILFSFILSMAYPCSEAQTLMDTIELSYGQDYTRYFDSLYQNVKFSNVPFDILYDRVVSFASLPQFGVRSSDTSSRWHFIQAYSELQRAAVVPQKELACSVDSLIGMDASPMKFFLIDFQLYRKKGWNNQVFNVRI
jgi:hypothetical protein